MRDNKKKEKKNELDFKSSYTSVRKPNKINGKVSDQYHYKLTFTFLSVDEIFQLYHPIVKDKMCINFMKSY